MTDHIPVRRLFETHLTVSDLQRYIGFYRDVVGLKLAFEASDRNVAFLWTGDSGKSMLEVHVIVMINLLSLYVMIINSINCEF
jgi:catechol-2,3-dioxygenase